MVQQQYCEDEEKMAEVQDVAMPLDILREAMAQADSFELLVDNPRRPAVSLTEEYYEQERRSSMPRLTRTMSGGSILGVSRKHPSSARGRRKKLKMIRKKASKVFGGGEGGSRKIGKSKSSSAKLGDRWKSSSSSRRPPLPVCDESPMESDRFPDAAPSSAKNDVPSVPVRRISIEKFLKAPIRRSSLTQLVGGRRRSSLEREEARNSGKPLQLPVRRTSEAQRPSVMKRRSSTALATSQLISSAIDELKLYDSDDESEDDTPDRQSTVRSDSEMDLKAFLASRNAVIHAFRIKAG